MQAAWRMIEAADTRCIGQVESPGFQALLRRVRDASRDGPAAGPAISSLEQLAQLLALWRPGAAGQGERGGLSRRSFRWAAAGLFPPGARRRPRSDARSPAVRRPGRGAGAACSASTSRSPIGSAARWPPANALGESTWNAS